MTTKASIARNVSYSAKIPSHLAQEFTQSFINLIVKKSKYKNIKISKFGTFSIHKTSERYGRNPKTKESYIIPSLRKLKFKPSNILRKSLN